jgi:glucokinase
MNQELAIGIDLGGTNVRIALMSSSGEMSGMYQQPTHGDRSITEILESIAEGIEHVIDEQGIAREDIVGVGLGAPGFLSLASGVIHTSPNLPTAHETPVVSLLQRLTDLPVYLENDANAAAIGEHWIGAGQGSRNLLCITLGTGLGSGFILDGTIWHGSNDFAGELGHTALFPGGLPCNCGRKGCLEAYVSATGIVNRAVLALKEGRKSSLKPFLKEEQHSLTSLIIFEHAQQGDRLARDLFEESGRYLGIALVNVLHMLDLETIIIGGQVAQAGEILLSPAIHEVEKNAIGARYYPIGIVPAKLGNQAGIIGAAKTAFDQSSQQ